MLLQDLFADAAARHREHIAIDVPPGTGRPRRQTATYGQLGAMAERLRRALQPSVQRECIVAVLLPRNTPALYAAQLAVLQAGAAHVCLDPAFPDAHLLHVLDDSGAVALLTDDAGARRTAGRALAVLDVHAIAAEGSGGQPPGPPPAPPPWLHDRALAYVIYTSGTTGRPKGVQIEQRGVTSLITAGIARFGIAPGDRIAQGSSPAYDSSIEETWLALLAGATLVVLDDETVRLGPDLVPWLRQERITVFCPPPLQLRAMACSSPKAELPQLRLCYVGGEALPQDVADLWAAELWLENGYGPTECTVTVVRNRVHAGEPVAIGTPVPGNFAHVLDEQLTPVADGDPGELCIGGIGLARGYLGQAELTAQRFLQHHQYGRIYRTGDLVRQGHGGQLFYLGRIDAQVKLRGHRIELEAIEAALARLPGVREAACRLQGEGVDKMLVAFVVVAGDAAPGGPELQQQLRGSLPDHMVPARIGRLPQLPRTLGGKLDRRALPELAAPVPPKPLEACLCPRQRKLAAAFASTLGPDVAIAPDDDFFALGGDSLRAATLVSRLRRDPDTAHLTVRDVYRLRTVAALAAREPGARPAAPPPAVRHAAATSPVLATAVQVLGLLLWLGAGSAAASFVALVLLPWLCQGSLWSLPLLLPLLGAGLLAAYAIAVLAAAVVGKRLLIGRYTACRVPAWSWFHVRHWLVVRTVRLFPWWTLQGTVLTAAVLRLLGARIGRRVHIHRGVDLQRGGWDLLEIGDEATVGREASLGLADFDDGHLVIGPVRIGAGALLSVRAGVAAYAEIGDGAEITPLSIVGAHERVPAGERWDGVPARPAGKAPPAAPITIDSRQWSPLVHGLWLVAARVAMPPLLPAVLLALLLGIAGIDLPAFGDWLQGEGPRSQWTMVLAVVGFCVLAVPVTLLGQALLMRWTPALPVGTVGRWSTASWRVLLRMDLLESAGNWLSGTLFWPCWLRLAGMRIGRKSEASTILDVLPEHVAIGAESFLADGIYLGVPRFHRSTITMAETVLGARTFLGNHVVVPGGQRLPDDVLLGVSTIADDRVMVSGSSWFGHPAFVLPRREVVRGERRLTHEPSLLRYCNRVFWEALRMLLPALPAALWLWWFETVAAAHATSTLALLWVAPAATLTVVAVQAAVVLGMKWLLLGRVRPGLHALWSCWASRWDFHDALWTRYGRGLTHLEGTLLLSFYLRAIGMRIGRRVVLGDGFSQVVDPDMLTIEDGATVHAMFQAHSFEDRVLKMDRVRIGAGATVCRAAVVLYGADVGEGCQVGAHSVVMKHEHLQPGRRYVGAPTVETDRIAASSYQPEEAESAEASAEPAPSTAH